MSFFQSLPGVSALANIADLVTDVSFWRSLGWLILGVVLILGGLAALLHQQIRGLPIPVVP